MIQTRKRKVVLFGISIGLVIFIGLLIPFLTRSGVSVPLCPLQQVSAQGDNPCLDREVTISAQEVQILQLQGTINAQAIAGLNNEGTLTSLRATVNSQNNSQPNRIVITVPVVITATKNPSDEIESLVTATPPSNELAETATPLPPHCILYTIKDGDTPFSIAQQYGIDGNELLAVNGLDSTSASFLEIGDVLIIPLPGCSLTTTGQNLSTPTTTASMATVTNAQVEIVRVLNPGDINAEGVDIRNNGAVIDLTGWKLKDTFGDIYTFPQQRLFTGSVITVYTRVGSDTPTAKFWGRSQAVWYPSAYVRLFNVNNQLESLYQIPFG